MLLLQQIDGLCAALAALLPSCNLPLRPPQRGLRLPKAALGGATLSPSHVTNKAFKPRSMPIAGPDHGGNGHIAQVARTDDVPTIGFTLESDRLDPAFDWTMQLDLHAPNVLERDTAPVKPAPVAHGRKLHRIKAVSALKARIAVRSTRFHAPEERLKRLVQSATGC